MTMLIAVHEIIAHDPKAGLEHTGRFDETGEPILVKVLHTVSPGEQFDEPDDAEVKWLLQVGAARLPEAWETIL